MNIFLHFIEDCIRNISGPIGIRLRRAYYKRRLKSAGSNLFIDTGVHISNASFISLGDRVWIDKNVVLIAGPVSGKNIKERMQDGLSKGALIIGSYSHLGIGTIIQAHAGVKLGEGFTTSTHCRIYSFSNIPQECKAGTISIPEMAYEPSYLLKSVVIGRNVWLGLNVTVISSSIGDDVFVMPHSVVYKSLGNNSVASGNPAEIIKRRFE